jgi:hypothetical protein
MHRFYPLACRIPHKENVKAVALRLRMGFQVRLKRGSSVVQAQLQARLKRVAQSGLA